MPKGWDPNIGRDPWWWLGVIAGVCVVVGAAGGVAAGRKLVRR